MDLDTPETAIVRVTYARPPKSERGDPRDRDARRTGPSGPRGNYDQGDPNGPYGGSDRERGPGGSGGPYGGERGSSRPGNRPSGWYAERGAPEARGGFSEGGPGGYRRPSGFSDGAERGSGGGGGPGRGGGRPSGFSDRAPVRREPNPRSPPARLPPPGDRRPRSNAPY